MPLRPLLLPVALAICALLVGCTPQIGNSCSQSTDCSQLGDRLCDTTEPGGYCTIFNCEPDTCPNSVCVAFDPTLDPACGAVDDGRYPRFESTFCMKACNSDGDCRDGYQCIDLSVPANQVARRAQVVDQYANDGGDGYAVCMVAPLGPDGGITDAGLGGTAPMGGTIAQVCKPSTAYDGGIPWTPYDAGSEGLGDAGP